MIELHEVIRSDFERLLHALTNGDGRHDNDEFAPAIALVQLEHGLDVDIRLARSGFHFHVQRAAAQLPHQMIGQANIVLRLNGADVLKQFVRIQSDIFVFIAGIIEDIVEGKLRVGKHRKLPILRRHD